MKLSKVVHIPANNTTLVPSGLVNVTVKSLIYVCVPTRFRTFTSVIVPPVGIVIVEVTVGVPDAEIATGTTVEAVVEHVFVPKLKVEDQGEFPQPDTTRTLQ